MNEQAKRIENREGLYWKSLSNKEIEEKVNFYNQAIGDNYRIIETCLRKLAVEYKWSDN